MIIYSKKEEIDLLYTMMRVSEELQRTKDPKRQLMLHDLLMKQADELEKMRNKDTHS